MVDGTVALASGEDEPETSLFGKDYAWRPFCETEVDAMVVSKKLHYSEETPLDTKHARRTGDESHQSSDSRDGTPRRASSDKLRSDHTL